jgi:hypothetical protein
MDLVLLNPEPSSLQILPFPPKKKIIGFNTSYKPIKAILSHLPTMENLQKSNPNPKPPAPNPRNSIFLSTNNHPNHPLPK